MTSMTLDELKIATGDLAFELSHYKRRCALLEQHIAAISKTPPTPGNISEFKQPPAGYPDKEISGSA